MTQNLNYSFRVPHTHLEDYIRSSFDPHYLLLSRIRHDSAHYCALARLSQLPQLWDPVSGNIFRDEGDQQRIWDLTRFFVERVAAEVRNPFLKPFFCIPPSAACAPTHCTRLQTTYVHSLTASFLRRFSLCFPVLGR